MKATARHILYLALIVIATPSLVGCDISAALTDRGGRIAYATDINPLLWRDVAVIDVPNYDTLSKRSLSLFVRHQPQEMLDSLGVKIFTVAPDETIIEEHFTVHLDESSHKRRNSTKTNEITLHEDVILGQRGEYRLYIFPKTPTKGVEAVGISVKRNRYEIDRR